MKIKANKVFQVEHENFSHKDNNWLPYVHQALIYDKWEQSEGLLLTTKTGSGKTVSASYPVVDKKESAIFIYPTNALIDDQIKSIQKMMKNFQKCYYYYNPEKDYDKVKANNSDLILLKIDSESLNTYRKRSKSKRKGMALNYLLSINKPTIIMTNPDTLFYILALKYSQSMEIWNHLKRFDTLVIDEFHLYGGIELAHILFMIEYSKEMGIFKKYVLLSATPDKAIQEILENLISIEVITPLSKSNRKLINTRKISYEVNLYPKFYEEDVIIKALNIVENEIGFKKIETLYNYCKRSNDHVPLVVIFNSVINAIRFEDELAKKMSRDKIGVFRGLSDKSIRSFINKLIVVGTSAIEVGIDFKCDYLIFEAGDKASFMQRFGRIGRHAPGVAYLLCSKSNICKAFSEKSIIDRNQLEEIVNQLYSKVDARPWFLKTFGGIFTISTLGNRLVKLVINDINTTEKINKDAKNMVDKIVESYSKKIGAERQFYKLKSIYNYMTRYPHKLKWISVYENNISFRSSLLNIEVFDIREEMRRNNKGLYNVDLRTLLTRGVNIHYDMKKDRVTLAGYKSSRNLIEVCEIENLDKGNLYVTDEFEGIAIYCENKYSSLTNKLLKESHIFTVVPKITINYIDWRLSVFNFGMNSIIAFDGAALLLKEIYIKYVKH